MLTCNAARVEKLLHGLAGFSSGGPGVTRLAYTQLDRQAQDWLLAQIADLKLEMREDAVGNLFLRRPGKQRQLAPVAAGSHLDSVIHAGAYDGICGVVGALEALYMLRESKLERDIEIIIFRAEESSRFGFATIGSKLLTGKGKPSDFDKATKQGEASFSEALAAWGCNPDNYAAAVLPVGTYKAFAEMHIEQGKVLEATATQLGIVHHIAAPTRFKIFVKGLADHSGATPMGFRRDALVSAARVILAVEAAATAEKEYGTVATVGIVETEPGSINVVPGEAVLWTDLRGVDEASIARTLTAIDAACERIAAQEQTAISRQMLTADHPVALDEKLAALVEDICRAKGFSFRHMVSGAGHDAMHMASICPTTLIFLPCRGGISHNPAEYAATEDICRAIEVLAALLEEQANS